VHRQAELTNQRCTRRLASTDTPAEVFDLHIGNLPAGRDSELIAVHDAELRPGSMVAAE
jgi:hypothetical protein